MRGPFEILGVAADADERTIKRAYAILLRNARPDDDAEAFQHLNEAYRNALAWARHRLQHQQAEDAAPDEPDAAPPSSDAPSTNMSPLPQAAPAASAAHDAPIEAREPAPAFDQEAFVAEVLAIAGSGDTQALGARLAAEPGLWSLAAKQEAGMRAIASIVTLAPPMPERSFDELLRFFDLDHVFAGHDALRLTMLRQRLDSEWQLQRGDWRALNARLHRAAPNIGESLDTIVPRLSRPFSWLRVGWYALKPKQPSAFAAFAFQLVHDRVETLPPGLDRRQIAFWKLAGDRGRASWQRLFVGAVRCATILLLALVVDAGISSPRKIGPLREFTTIAIAITAGWLAYETWIVLRAWQTAPQHAHASRIGAWLRLMFIPALCCGTLWLDPEVFASSGSPAPLEAVVAAITLVALLLAVERYRVRAHRPPVHLLGGPGTWRLVFLWPVAKMIVMSAPVLALVTCAGAVSAFGTWLADLWKQRTLLRGSLFAP